MKIEDSFEVAAPRERVWQLITDPEIVAGCVPGCSGVEVVSDTLYRAKVSVKVGPIKASFNMEVELVEETPCLLYTSPSPRDRTRSRMPSSA